MIARCSICGLPILISILLQQSYGYSLIKSGLYLAIIGGASIVAKFFSTLIVKLGVRQSVILFALLSAVAIIFAAPLSFWVASGYLWVPCFFLGFSNSLLYTAMNSVLYISLPQVAIADASNIGNIIQQFSMGLGIVLAVGGFHLLLSSQGLQISSAHNQMQVAHFYGMLCNFFAGLMLINVFIAWPFKKYGNYFTAQTGGA
jgi:hypothetical protein